MRTILVHLNVEAPTSDDRSADQIADAILAAIKGGAHEDAEPGGRARRRPSSAKVVPRLHFRAYKTNLGA